MQFFLLECIWMLSKCFQSDRVQNILQKWTMLGFRIYCFKIQNRFVIDFWFLGLYLVCRFLRTARRNREIKVTHGKIATNI